MKLIVQRVTSARVAVGNSITAEIERGLLVLVGIHKNDTETEMQWLARKLPKLRIFEDEEGKMNQSVADIGGGLLLVSQFTLYGDVRKGTRPSFISAAEPEKGEQLYDAFVAEVRRRHPGRRPEAPQYAAIRGWLQTKTLTAPRLPTNVTCAPTASVSGGLPAV
ncbi:MAG: D-aminoacyl-tRNA deacylase, partial [Cyclonatronaceae bacterium]